MAIFDCEFSQCCFLDTFEIGAGVCASALLEIDLGDVYVGNRHNTDALDRVYRELASATPINQLDVIDEFNTVVYLHEYRGHRVVLDSMYIGVFCTKQTAMALLELEES